MKLTQGTIIQGRKSGNRYEIVEFKETKTIKWKGKLVTKDIYIVKDLTTKYPYEPDRAFKEMSSSIINKHYDIVKENNKC